MARIIRLTTSTLVPIMFANVVMGTTPLTVTSLSPPSTPFIENFFQSSGPRFHSIRDFEEKKGGR